VKSEKLNISVKNFSESFGVSGRLDAEYYQPKYDEILEKVRQFKYSNLGGKNGLVDIFKSIEPGSEAYQSEGIPFVRVSNMTKNEISQPEIKLDKEKFENIKKPKKDDILLTKDGSVGTAYKCQKDEDFITSGAVLHLTVKDTNLISPDYLTLVLNSKIVQLQAQRDAGGSIIQHWKPSEIEAVLIPLLPTQAQTKIAELIQTSFALRTESKDLLERAKREVEEEIERG
jgi:type I restriction enzyme, S subunit